MIAAAGFGSRMLPASKATPKELLTVVDRPVIQYIVEEALDADIEHVVFVLSRGKEAAEAYFDHNRELESDIEASGKTQLLNEVLKPILNQGRASFIRQGKASGIGHAIWCARDIVANRPFADLLPDVICAEKPSATRALIDVYEENSGCAIAVNAVSDDDLHKYGVISLGSGPRIGTAVSVGALVERPPRGQAPTNLAITGRFVLTPDIFGHLEKAKRGAGD
jgi:UTP--glucose-1-phosphate uridylyltransferase